MNLLSIQSHVAYGHVGNSAAVFALQRLGIEVWPVHTVQFSNHPGYGAWKGAVFDARLIRDVVEGVEDRGVLGGCDGVLSGYMGSVETGEAILEAVARVKRANPAARYCCDPVVGDFERGVYVGPGLPEFIRDRVLAYADIVTPNQFELEHLTGHAARTLADALAAIDALHARGPGVVLVTSLQTDATPAGMIDVVASDRGGRFRVRTPQLPTAVHGAGDLIAALFLAFYLRDGSPAPALAHAVSSVFGVLERSAEARAKELLLIEAQQELVAPSRCFEAERL
jgi:pyridoxine kinase